MILCITPDHDVYRYADDTPAERLQELYDDDCVVLRIAAAADHHHAEEWIGAADGVPPIGWTRIENIE